MRNRAGFTLIETLICLSIVVVALFPFLDMVDAVRAAYYRSIRTVDLATEVDKTQLRISAILSSHPEAKISTDNRSVTWPGGGVIWKDENLLLQDGQTEQFLAKNVKHFSLFSRDGLEVMTLELEDPLASRSVRKMLLLGGQDES